MTLTPVCPFAKAARPDDVSLKKTSDNYNKPQPKLEGKVKPDSTESATISPKCPLGYDSQTFKIGPFSCMICQALLFQSSRCVPCSHVYCKACISRFKDCPLCGADIEKIKADTNLQNVVDRFIEGHARIKRQLDADEKEVVGEKKTIIYEDVSLERGAFLVQQAMRTFGISYKEQEHNRAVLSARSSSGDARRAMGDGTSAVTYFEESVSFLSKVSTDDLEITHTLSVSLNKIGDLKYYDEDLEAARSYYCQALDVRRNASNHPSSVPSQILDVAVSLAKVADLDRNLGNDNAATDGFQEGIKLLESLKLNSEELGLEQRRLSVLESLNSRVSIKQSDSTS